MIRVSDIYRLCCTDQIRDIPGIACIEISTMSTEEIEATVELINNALITKVIGYNNWIDETDCRKFVKCVNDELKRIYGGNKCPAK